MSGIATDNSAGSVNAGIGISGSPLGTALTRMLLADGIEPGSDPSYELCKTLYAFHPLGAKIVDDPIALAQSQPREITVPDSPGERVKEAFEAKWTELGLDGFIFGTVSTSRMYGIGGLIYGAVNKDGAPLPTNEPIDPWDIAKYKLYFSIVDPLNTSGSLVLDQNPNAPDFQKAPNISVAGVSYHRSRSCVIMNERPIYIEYTNSAFGYVGRSVYQRALFPLKSFIRSMITDDMVTTKAGVLIAKVKQSGSIVNNPMSIFTGRKRSIVKEATTNNVISIDPEESIETLNMMNIDGAYGMARKNILENIAAAVPMPAIMLNGETFAEGFGEGTEDAKKIAHYINGFRIKMLPMYMFCDRICMHAAWTPEFYEAMQAEFPDRYKGVDYKTAFYQWKNSFKAVWPSLLIEPESERAKSEDVKLKAAIAYAEVMFPQLPQDQKAEVIRWMAENVNDMKLLFTSPLVLDYDVIAAYEPAPVAEPGEPDEPMPESGRT